MMRRIGTFCIIAMVLFLLFWVYLIERWQSQFQYSENWPGSPNHLGLWAQAVDLRCAGLASHK